MYHNVRVSIVSSQAGTVAAPDRRLLAGARQVLAEHGLSGLTLERLSAASGMSRMTLNRRRVTVPAVVAALVADAGREYLAAVLPAVTGRGDAATRLRAVLLAMFTVADRHLPLLAGMYHRPDSVFHEPASPAYPGGSDDARIASTGLFTGPLSRLLRDGATDGSLRVVPDPDASATALFNVAGWGYVHLRHAQRWTGEEAAQAVLDLVLPGLATRAS